MPLLPDARRRSPATAAALLAALIVLALIAGRNGVGGTERTIFEAFNRLPEGWGLLLFPVLQLGTLLTGPALALAAEFAGRRVLAVELLVAGPAGWLAARLLKALVARPRPSALLDEVVIRGGEAGGLGFPSGHVTIATALATILSAWLPRRWLAPLWLAVAAVAVARLYTGAHLPLDVIGGVLLGVLVGTGVRVLSHVALRDGPAVPVPE